jgi:hypothetical protein
MKTIKVENKKYKSNEVMSTITFAVAKRESDNASNVFIKSIESTGRYAGLQRMFEQPDVLVKRVGQIERLGDGTFEAKLASRYSPNGPLSFVKETQKDALMGLVASLEYFQSYAEKLVDLTLPYLQSKRFEHMWTDLRRQFDRVGERYQKMFAEMTTGMDAANPGTIIHQLEWRADEMLHLAHLQGYALRIIKQLERLTVADGETVIVKTADARHAMTIFRDKLVEIREELTESLLRRKSWGQTSSGTGQRMSACADADAQADMIDLLKDAVRLIDSDLK